MTGSPIIRSLLVPMVITGSLYDRLTLMIARSVTGSRPTMVAEWLVAGNKLGDVRDVVGERDLNLSHAFDHVVVREDVAALVDHNAGAHAVYTAARPTLLAA